jgi:hypothetical protein
MTDFTGNISYSIDNGIIDYEDLTLGTMWKSTMPSSTTYTIASGTGSAGSIFTSTGTYTNPTWTTGPSVITQNPVIATSTGTMTLTGEKADIVVNGRSLMDAIDKIEQRLGIMRPDPELEKEWAELKQLGDQYRQLEADIREKMQVWETLKKQDL